MNNILFLDTSAFIYRIAHFCKRYNTFTPNLIKLNFQFLNEARFLLLSNDDRNKVIWCLDCEERDYWRKTYAPEYKAQRKATLDEPTYNLVTKCFHSLKHQFSYLECPGFEADDLVALGVSLFEQTAHESCHCYIVSPDSDWQGLVGDRVTFVTPTFIPYVRRKKEVYEYLVKSWAKQSKVKRRLWSLPAYEDFKPSDIWVWKSKVGDRSDNLPAGTNISLIDLHDPLETLPKSYVDIAYDQISKAAYYDTDITLTMNYMSELLNTPMTIIKDKQGTS